MTFNSSSFKTRLFPVLSSLIFGAAVLSGCAPTTSSTTTTQAGGPTATVTYSGPKARIAVGGFNGRGRFWGDLEDSLTSALFQTGRFIVLERGSLSAVRDEAGFLGNPTVLEGADLLLTGAITAYDDNVGGAGVSVLGVNLGGSTSYIAADLRLVDVRTRRIVATTKVEGRTNAFNASVYRWYGGVSTNSSPSMDQAVNVMLDNAVKQISATVPESYYRVK